MADKYPTPKDMEGINHKLATMEKLGKQMEATKDQDELVAINEKMVELAKALTAEVAAFEKEFREATLEAQASGQKLDKVKLEKDQIDYVHQLTGESVGYIEVPAPAQGETLPLTKDEVTFLAVQEAKRQAEHRQQMKEMKKAQREAEEANRKAEEERREALNELRASDPEAAAKLEAEIEGR